MMSTNQLSYYARQVADAKGLKHQMMVMNLRIYINSTLESQLVEQIEVIYRSDELKALWEAGLNTTLQDAVMKRLEELKARRD